MGHNAEVCARFGFKAVLILTLAVSLCCAPPVIGQDRSSDTAGRGTPADAADSSAVSGAQDNAAAPEKSATPAQNATADTAGAPAAKDAQAREEKAAPAAA